VAQDPLAHASPSGPEVVRYGETLRVPLRWWALATTFDVTVLVAFAVALPLAVALASVAVLVLLSTVWFLGYGSARVVVTDRLFRAGRAQIPVSLLAEPRALSGEETWQAAGPGADARAYLLLRPYARESVMVQLRDPADPTPYWLVSTRRPTQLAAALAAAVPGPGVSPPGHGAEWAEPDPGDPARLTD
jgi:hypothetical protein